LLRVLPALPAPCQQRDPPFSCPFAVPETALRRRPHERLSALEERELFQHLARIRQRLAELVPAGSSATPGDRIEVMRLTCQACSLRRYLAQCYFKLAVSVARACAAHYQEIDDLVGQACVTLMRALDLFEVQRGYRFSSYATRAMRSELGRYLARRRRVTDRSVDPKLLQAEAAAPDRGKHPGHSAYCALEQLLDDLEPREADVVRSRFGLHDRPGAQTLQAVADRLGISRERVRQLEQQALQKLRRRAQEKPWSELLHAPTIEA
jgi:RNA polymerase sigma factor (sigma-70 family)